MGTPPDAAPPRPGEVEAEALLRACRLLVAVSVQSLGAVDNVVTLPELRALVVLASRGPCSLSALAEYTGLHLSKASRMCDRLATRGLLSRGDDPSDRRTLQLGLTAAGRRVVERVSTARREALEPLLQRMSPDGLRQLIALLAELTEKAETSDEHLWALGWPT